LNYLCWFRETPSGVDITTIKEPCGFKSLKETPLDYIRTAGELNDCIEEILSSCTLDGTCVLGVDLEHHSLHSYKGFCCLIQLSTRAKDFIIDPFEIFEELHVLNRITTNPRIIKIFHGADSDIQWLQRDFSVYVVNMFDTGQAARVLGVPGGYSLGNVLTQCCQVKVDKTHQKSDWRQRPLPDDMITYARSDTHYLPYLFDVMRNKLLAKPPIGDYSLIPAGTESGLKETESGLASLQLVLDRSRAICLSVYSERMFDPTESATRLTHSQRAILSPKQYVVLQY